VARASQYHGNRLAHRIVVSDKTLTQFATMRRSALADGRATNRMAADTLVNRRMNGSEWLALVLLSVLWGGSFFFAGVLIKNLLTDDEKITGNRLVGVAIGFVGVVVLIGPDSLKGLGTNVLAQVAVLTAAVFYAFAGVYGRRFKAMGIDPILTATGQVTASALMLFPIAMFVAHPWTLPIPALPAWAAIIGSATLSTALGYVLYFRILSTTGATNLLLVTFLIPVSAIIMGIFGLGERLDVRHFTGLALIGAGLAAIDGSAWRECVGPPGIFNDADAGLGFVRGRFKKLSMSFFRRLFRRRWRA